ncbi:MAG: hypothetical protein LBF41_05570 [Deltaproteobacteria bacterium]|jgi:hypothetical protein|nr:hypothetical protein [Deltaproteobacteria bacterium]
MAEKKPSKNEDRTGLSEAKSSLDHSFARFREKLSTEEQVRQARDLFDWMMNLDADLVNLMKNNENSVSMDMIERIGVDYDEKFRNIFRQIITNGLKKTDETEIIVKKNESTRKKG